MGEIAPTASVAASDVELAAGGDEVAFARLVGRHHADMARVAYVITGDYAAAQDAVQSAWLKAWRNLGSVRDPLRVRGWLVTTAANEARRLAQRRGRTRVVELTPDIRSTIGDPGTGIARIDLVRALNGLSAEDRTLLALRYVVGLDAEELGSLTGRSASGVRARLSRLTARLRRELHDG